MSELEDLMEELGYPVKKTVREIADETDMSKDQVHRILKKAEKKLVEELRDGNNESGSVTPIEDKGNL